jgi:hypothetical protein
LGVPRTTRVIIFLPLGSNRQNCLLLLSIWGRQGQFARGKSIKVNLAAKLNIWPKMGIPETLGRSSSVGRGLAGILAPESELLRVPG